MDRNTPHDVDCLVIGGGPAGLIAAVYLRRFLRTTLIVDDGNSRALKIPESHNYPGFTGGISGEALLQKLRTQARDVGAQHAAGRVEALERDDDGFVARFGNHEVRAARVLLATGLTDKLPDLDGLRDPAAQKLLRFCPVCDAYEARDRRIGVLGQYQDVIEKARFLRSYSADVTILSLDEPSSGADADIAAVHVRDVMQRGDGFEALLHDGTNVAIEVLYPMVGCTVHSALARDLGAVVNEVGCLKADDHLETGVSGLYAAGDVVSDLHQLSVAAGHAAIAATAIHKKLPHRPRERTAAF